MRGIFFNREQRRKDDSSEFVSNNNKSKNGTCNLTVLIQRHQRGCLSPLSLDDHDDNDVVSGGSRSDRIVVRKYSYVKLPQQLFKLTVLKLDGSSFDVSIGRNATVAELKQAVEEIFTSSPEEGGDKISWSHVWGHFCLSYENQKLISDKVCIKSFGIKDGDQLQFIRHMSINYPNSRRFHGEIVAYKPLSTCAEEEKEGKAMEDHINTNKNEDYKSDYYCEEDEEDIPISEFKLAHFLRGWLSYSRLWGTNSRKGSQGQNRPSRFALQCLGGRPRMIKLQS